MLTLSKSRKNDWYQLQTPIASGPIQLLFEKGKKGALNVHLVTNKWLLQTEEAYLYQEVGLTKICDYFEKIQQLLVLSQVLDKIMFSNQSKAIIYI